MIAQGLAPMLGYVMAIPLPGRNRYHRPCAGPHSPCRPRRILSLRALSLGAISLSGPLRSALIPGIASTLSELRIEQLATRHVGPIDLCVEAGECVCIHGASGSGKSLLLRAIADLDPHTGQAWVDNVVCTDLPAPQWRRNVTLLPAESHWWHERVGDHFEQPAEDWLDRLDLPRESLDWELARCSTGERQRLALLRVLVQRPGVLLLDEPTGNLDAHATQRVEALIEDYRQQENAAVLWVSHAQGQIDRVARRTFQLIDGRLRERMHA